MIKIDLVTGFLGSGKTTFIKKYARYLVDSGYNIGILENDYGAVNVDMMLLSDIMGERCHAEMVAGGCGEDCHRRRFKTKLIAMGMSGYDRVIVEPSGIFDVDEFLDVLHEEPLDKWYEAGSIISIVDAEPDTGMSKQSRYILASETANCGVLIMSKTAGVPGGTIQASKDFINRTLAEFQCERTFDTDIVIKDWDEFDDADYRQFMNAGYDLHDYVKLWFKQSDVYKSVYIMNKDITKDEVCDIIGRIFADRDCGDVLRIKGFVVSPEGGWTELNATADRLEARPIAEGQKIIIVIGSNLAEERIQSYFENGKKTHTIFRQSK